jgi:hypothetical protein
LADNGEKFALATVYARDIKTHLEHAIIVPDSIVVYSPFSTLRYVTLCQLHRTTDMAY